MSRTSHRRRSRKERDELVCFSGHYNCWMMRERLIRTGFSERYCIVLPADPKWEKRRKIKWKNKRDSLKCQAGD